MFGHGKFDASDIWLEWIHPRVASLWNGQAHASLMKETLHFQVIHCLSDRRSTSYP